jgi:DNA-binding MarR family transcriptional regulator
LVDALLTASRALVGVAARSLAAVTEADGVTLPQYRALVVLATRPGTGVNDLADALDIHPSTATRLCDRLVAKQLVERVAGVADRRSIELHLAPAGRRLVATVASRRRREVAAIAARMSPADQRRALHGLQAFAAATGEPVGIDLFGWHAAEAVGDER